ncbi:MAG: MoaD/ThiS family protein [Deltaproteobacteria bacterium]|nr:MoaD/ThiS family protein [Deltaproteobacteria bacterium]MBW2245907.1 MoaD/ThiS family protein [Deltaproteobacteria bacterium]MBW2597798.1 MoaD/ThiS family protein [Deltaproteobacteria bacterium]MBW2639703.1 MoaD/ThiS family protein [Deltaproteobacteria bacterium]MBW2679350.1 MoaD/ThiS family protein [Deltaproteobacteria bacterium]
MIKINGKEHSWYEGMTIKDLLKNLNNAHLYAVVRINEKHISMPYFEKTLVPDNSEVFLIPMIAGG